VKVSGSAATIAKASRIIFPGVGNFSKAMSELKKRKILHTLKEKIGDGTPFLGICLGMQLLLETSQEAPGIKGLGVIKGKVKKFSSKNLIVPHMGWNQVKAKKNKLFKGVSNNSFFYFAHSYYCEPKDKKVILSTTNYGLEFASSLYKDNVWAVQFHPEKSQQLGLKVFSNFLKLC
jgi:imidazole glycerol phosphate synthase glutamine amidotransferase subunit